MYLSSFRKISLYLSILFLLLILPSIVESVEISNIYQVNLQVKEQSKQSRLKASLNGLKQVLVKRSGSTKILDTSEAISAYNKVTSYLQKFEYSKKTNIDNEFAYIISLYFEPRLIDELIKRANQPLWDSNRPISILWIAQEEIDNDVSLYRRIIIDNEKEELINEHLQTNSKRRGVPFILPLMDLDDDLLVSKSDVWGRFPNTIIEASKRYSVNSIIIGKVYKRGKLWFGQFTYYNQSNKINFEHQFDNVELIYKNMFDSLAEILCEQYCVTQTVSDGQVLHIEIENISNFEIFQKVKNYLSSLSAVRNVQILNIDKDKILIKLDLLSSENTVIESLSLNHRLKVIEKTSDTENNKVNEQKNISETSINNNVDTTTLEQLNIKKNNTVYYRWVN